MYTCLILLRQGLYSPLGKHYLQGVQHTSMLITSGKHFLQRVRSASTTFLCKINKYHNQYQEYEDVQSLNAFIDNPSIDERIKFYHAFLFSPTLQTLSRAIDAGYLTTFPSITLRQLQKYPPRSKSTVKGHLESIKKGLRYAQIPQPIINNTTATSASTPTIIE